MRAVRLVVATSIEGRGTVVNLPTAKARTVRSGASTGATSAVRGPLEAALSWSGGASTERMCAV
jgi:hypothetical protein